jgi:hypothetical protein
MVLEGLLSRSNSVESGNAGFRPVVFGFPAENNVPEDRVIGLCVLASLLMAAIGGCWWPLEIGLPRDENRGAAHVVRLGIAGTATTHQLRQRPGRGDGSAGRTAGVWGGGKSAGGEIFPELKLCGKLLAHRLNDKK